MNLTHPFLDEDGDKLREECGVFGAVNATDASAVTALGLHALQHRGQEAAGITSFEPSMIEVASVSPKMAVSARREAVSSEEARAAICCTMAGGCATGVGMSSPDAVARRLSGASIRVGILFLMQRFTMRGDFSGTFSRSSRHELRGRPLRHLRNAPRAPSSLWMASGHKRKMQGINVCI